MTSIVSLTSDYSHPKPQESDNPEGDGKGENESESKELDEKTKVKDEGKNGTADEAKPVKLRRKGRRGRSSGSLTMKGDKITSFTTERGIKYHPNDHVFIENNRPNQPFFICTIQDFSVTRRDTLVVKVKWYYRVSEVPDSVYQHLVQDRYDPGVIAGEVVRSRASEDAGPENAEKIVQDPRIRSRELFVSEATDTYPVTALRGKCKVVHCQDVQAAKAFQRSPDSFYYILGYNPETKRLATTQGQIRVGSMHQARMPECKPNTAPCDMPETCDNHEDLGWQPQSVLDGDLMMYLRAARSVAAFAGMCDGGSTEDGCQAASMDDTTINAMHMLHKLEYDTGRALQALVKAPALRTIDKKWNEEDTKRFVKGLRLYGKNFFKIRKELLSHRETGELVEFYYFWKKTPQAAANRPHRRHRRHGVKRATTRSQRPASSEFLDLSSASECSDNESEDSDTRDLGAYRCQNCFVTVSKDWSNAGKPSPRLCSKCRIFFKKYGEDRPLDNAQDSYPYFKPVQNDDQPISGAQTMRTRHNRDSVDSKDKKKLRTSTSSPDNIDSPLSDLKKGRRSPSTLSSCSTSSTDRDKKKEREESESPIVDKTIHNTPGKRGQQFAKRKRREDGSDYESGSDSTSISGNEEENGNDGDIETNQDDLSSSSLPTTPSPIESDYKQDKSSPVPTPIESTLGDKLADLPRPEPQLPPAVSPGHISLTSPAHPTIPSPLPVPSLLHLPALPPFAFSQQSPLPDKLFPGQPLPGEPLLPQRPPLIRDEVKSLSPAPRLTPVSLDPSRDRNHGRDLDPSRDRNHDRDLDLEPSPFKKIKEEPVSPPLSPRQVSIKQEPKESVDFVEAVHGSFNPSASGKDRNTFSVPDRFELVTPKIEQGTQPPHLSDSGIGTASADRPSVCTSVSAEDHSREQGQGHKDTEPFNATVDMEEDEMSDREGTLTPGPVPTPCKREIHRSKSAIFIKILNRGENNSCTRCDLMFKPLPDSKLARKREEREKKVVVPPTPTPTPTPTPAKEEKRKAETPPPNSTADAQVVSNIPPQQHHSYQDRVTPRSSYQDTPALRQLSKYAEPHVMGQQDPRSMQPYSMGGFSPFMDPLRMASMYPPNSRERLEMELEQSKRERDARERELREHELRSMEMREKLKAELEMKPPGLERLLPPGANQLDPHWLELQRRYPGYPMLPGGVNVSNNSHLPGVYPPTSIASDLIQRERDRLERLGLPSAGLHPVLLDSPYSAAIMERLSVERMSAERLSAEQRMSAERMSAEQRMSLERMSAEQRMSAERMSAERLQAERMALATDPMVRLQMGAAAAAAAAAHAHNHTHAHSHTHLHLHQPDGLGPPPPSPLHIMPSPLPGQFLHGLPPDILHSDQMTSRMIYQIYTQRLTNEQHVYMQRVSNECILRAKHDRQPQGANVDPAMSHLIYQFSRADPMAGVNGANNSTPPGSSNHPSVSLPPGMQHHHPLLSGREQELMQQSDLYRRAYSDPALAQQLQAQHEVLQRMAIDRERFGSGHLPPH